jgi:hypothetical protein
MARGWPRWPARPRSGDLHARERSAGDELPAGGRAGRAEDQATILRTGSATLPDGRVVDTIVVRDFNPLNGSRGTKVYGQGVGLIEDGPLRLLRVNGV